MEVMAKNIEKCKCDDINDNKCDNIDKDKFDSVCYECLKESFNFDSIDKKRFKKEVYNGEELLKKLYIDILCKYEICVENKSKKLVISYFNNETKIELLSNQLIIYIDKKDKYLKCIGSTKIKNKFKDKLKAGYCIFKRDGVSIIKEIKNKLKDDYCIKSEENSNYKVNNNESIEETIKKILKQHNDNNFKDIYKIEQQPQKPNCISVKNNKIYLFQEKIDKDNK